ncbi:ATP-binding cassette subfamily B protein [Pullulanibacillus pueri]|uniref:ABC transporter ATP-binding protein n=1 Tax=Pullulanibacillus pueri TaxID=1437324 RepID=A0A8J2ZTP6_9BACL|nr:ABC transporter transmembrane domain-containing protein [Pullulanibacillus pueri]MBM7681084.1 ATP-binding cassette subfamily B protein [Pullulanibacillus pueri]GGH76985.1 ABC transporter ATP-binding protein [Pullulanibacillus pueri]
MKVFIDLMWYFRQEKAKYIWGIVLLMCSSFMSMVPPFIVGVIVDDIRLHTLTSGSLFKWLSILIISGFAAYGFGYGWRMLIFGSSMNLAKLLRDRLFGHFTKMTSHFYSKRRIGDLMAHSTNDIRAVQEAAGDGILMLVDSITMGAMVIVAMAAIIDWRLTIIALIPMPFMAWAISHYGNLLHKNFHDAQAAFSELNDRVQENVSGVRVIKAFGEEQAEKENFRVQSADVVAKNIKVAKVDALFDPTITFFVGLSYFLTLVFGAIFVVHDSITIGELTSFSLYLGQLVWPMLAFGILFNIVERGRASYDRIRQLLKVKPDIVDRPNALAKVPSGDIAYRIETFRYTEDTPVVLKNIAFDLKQGQTIGIVGKTGSGKSTLVKLLLREMDCQAGDILIGGTSIYDYKMSSLRQAIGYVPQDHFLFSATVAENIAFAKPDATLEEIYEAAKLANIHEDILAFKEGYDTVVGERGVTMSGGQKQRVSIARALLINPEILILDDSLSAVDARTEEAILEALKRNRQNKTTFITAHRLSAIQHADIIIVLENGEIIEHGTHAELMAEDHWYRAMFRRQQLESFVVQGGISS